MRFSLRSIKRSVVLSAYDYCRPLFRCLSCAQQFDYRALGSSWKLRGAAEHFIDDSEKRICRLSFECESPHVIKRHSKSFALFITVKIKPIAKLNPKHRDKVEIKNVKN